MTNTPPCYLPLDAAWQVVMRGKRWGSDPLAQGWVSQLQQVNGQPVSLADLPLEMLAKLTRHTPELYWRLPVGLS